MYRPPTGRSASAASARKPTTSASLDSVADRARRNVERIIAPVSSSAQRHATVAALRAKEQGRTQSAAGARDSSSGHHESSSGGGHHSSSSSSKRVAHRAAWCFFAPSSNRAVEGALPSKSCYLMTAAVQNHDKALPSAKVPTATLDPHDPRFTQVYPRDVHGDCDIFTPVDRDHWSAMERIRYRFVPALEKTIAVRREKDHSRATIDNGYRQYIDKGDSKPLVARLLEGQFYNAHGKHQPRPFSYSVANRRNVRVASDVNHVVKHGGL